MKKIVLLILIVLIQGCASVPDKVHVISFNSMDFCQSSCEECTEGPCHDMSKYCLESQPCYNQTICEFHGIKCGMKNERS